MMSCKHGNIEETCALCEAEDLAYELGRRGAFRELRIKGTIVEAHLRQVQSEAVSQLKAVLCGPDGVVCIAGSDGDRAIVQAALKMLEQEGA